MNWGPTAINFLSSGRPIMLRNFVWFDTRDMVTNAIESFGYWSGHMHRNFVVNSQSRLYYGALGQLDTPAVVQQSGTNIQTYQIGMSIPSEVENMVRGQNMYSAPIEVHTGLFDPDTNSLVELASRFVGYVDDLDINTGPVNGVSSVTLTLVSKARNGTLTSNGKKSHESQKRRGGDTIRRWSSVGRVAADPWGAKS